ncbi:MAG: lipoyl(octanoyl) transferase [Elusimicrobia bacterium]|nr:MAG: lipoyl(octanoyl) transferase [Elusimicrobiota bacterium]
MILDWGRQPYTKSWEEQKRLVDQRVAGTITDKLIFVEHDPVYTSGTSAREKRHNSLPHPLLAVERGGDITYHGPGQLVGYPILHLKERGLLVGTLLRLLEKTLIDTLAHYHLEGRAIAGKTGVWVGDKKLASIGIAVRGWVSYHGFSLNADCDLKPFSAIRPCGFDSEVMSSVSELTGRTVGIEELKPIVRSAFDKRLQEIA